MMNPFKPITNPMLCGTMELLQAEDTPEHRKMFIDELVRARYLAPVVVTPTPQPDANGALMLTSEHKVELPLLAGQDGNHFLMAFTDIDALKKWNPDPNQQTFGFEFSDYAEMLFRTNKDGKTNPAVGIVINPFGNSFFVSKKMVAKVMISRMKDKGMPIPPMFQEENSAEEAAENNAEETTEN